jgi:large subunit ribosomal protein L3
MTRVYQFLLQVINIDSNRISQIKTEERDGYSAIQVAYGSQKESRLSKALLGHYKKSNIKPAKGQHEFRVKDLSERYVSWNRYKS